MVVRTALMTVALLAALLSAAAPHALADTKQEKARTQEKTAPCHPSYSGCLDANASDYDCAGGNGNGPRYTGRVRVLGPDVFRLDEDGDGWGCE